MAAGDRLARVRRGREIGGAVITASGTVTTLASAGGAFLPLTAVGFSPEGDRVLFSRTDAGDITSLWSVQADGSDARLLVPGSGWGDWQRLPAGP